MLLHVPLTEFPISTRGRVLAVLQDGEVLPVLHPSRGRTCFQSHKKIRESGNKATGGNSREESIFVAPRRACANLPLTPLPPRKHLWVGVWGRQREEVAAHLDN
ncbi:hypothetical protein C0Q70_14732 [Pomacea canaliculata]|uniref:Uncharacterized protein n=1 Tax=Pomacea canaliculata TaxID=400727 RepID=A0A2T7NSV6_POMCA|nr:hypothetical protein C0Q70_14732 [Pomacea canaliculata]